MFRTPSRALSGGGAAHPSAPRGACPAVYPRHYLSACLCFKNAATYLAEWLAFYTTLGVDHFFLYNNESSDRHEDVLAPYLAAGSATLIDYPGKGIQHALYAHCLDTFGSRTRSGATRLLLESRCVGCFTDHPATGCGRAGW